MLDEQALLNILETRLKEWMDHREQADIDTLSEAQKEFLSAFGKYQWAERNGMGSDPDTKAFLVRIIQESPQWLKNFYVLVKWQCVACGTVYAWAEQYPKESDNPPDPEHPGEQLHTLVRMCSTCADIGYVFQQGEVYIWKDSPADRLENTRCRKDGTFNPYHFGKTFTSGSNKGALNRTYTLRNYYKANRRK